MTIKPTEFLLRVARAHARANRSDPFAFQRMLTHLCNGIEDGRAVLAAARAKGGE